jgi:amino acid adenylation domain-containing protein/non-ribosomal peptide synthase protein (TIGR01720 family)
MQQGMLFHELTASGLSPYFRQVSFTLAGTVDPALTEATWNVLLARHALLRSIFDYERTAQPVQIVLRQQSVEFVYEDLADGDADLEARLECRWRRDAERGFDLRRDRLMRVQLFRLAPDRFEMVWSHPHILLDGWSGAVLLEEFAWLYAAARRGDPGDLPPPPDPGPCLATLAARDRAAALDHWATLLAGYEELATLPRLAARTGARRMAEHRFALGAPETAALTELARRHGATLAALLQALWGLLLGRWTDRRDVVFGVVVSGRSVATPGIDRLVGMFINTVPVRVRWDTGEDFGALLRTLHRQALDGMAHDHAALAEIQAACRLPTSLLDHVLVFENYPAAEAPTDTGFTVLRSTADEQANYDFGLLIHAGVTLDICIPYDASVFPAGQFERLEPHLRTLVAQVLAAPHGPAAAFDPLPPAERARLAACASGPVVSWPETATLAGLWRAQVDRAPDAVALVAGSRRLSYRELEAAAEGIAGRLRGAGLPRQAPVGVLAGRTAERIIALLGILQAGHVYLPLSPALPDERIAYMLDAAACRLVLADAAGLDRLAKLRPGVARSIAAPPAHARQESDAVAGDLAYIVYTSGSTGEPKGVAVEHRGFVNMILAQIAGFGVRPDDAVVQFASCSFDASLSEIFMALLSGARLVMAPEAAIRDGAALLALMATEGVTVATLPPSYLRALDRADLGALRVLITAGEPPDLQDARHYARRLRYFNAYGPSEASVCASWHEVDPDTPYPEGIPIGRAIANTTMAVLDAAGRPMPIGAVGEICLSGPGLARGYIGQPAATDARFPWIGGRRVYRTGDAGVMRAAGTVLYRGRRDGQVKLNGYRIELGEIESRLRDRSEVSQAAVAVREAPKRLAAYVVPCGPADSATLRRALAAALPPWMVPTEVILVPELPRTVAGKIDRRALALPASAPAAEAAPLASAEALVAAAFAAVLGGAGFGRDTSFAQSGGDSLRAIQLLGRLRRAGLQLELSELVAADTVAAIAAAATRATADEHRPVSGTMPLTPIQAWFFARQPGGISQFNHLVLLRVSEGFADERVLAAAFDALWRHHDGLRHTFRRGAEGWVQEVAEPHAPIPLRSVAWQELADPWPAVAVDGGSLQSGFDLGRGPLFKAVLYRLRDGDYLLLTAHHLVIDAASWRILLEDLATGLRQAASGQPVRLAGKTASYRDWAHALAAWSRAGAEAERGWWAAVAAAAIAPLPVDCAPTAHGYDATDLVSADLGPVGPGVSDRHILACLLGALGAALHSWDGRRTARVTLAGHGRTAPISGLDVSRTAGWFTAEYPFLLDCVADRHAIARALDAVPSQGLGWGALRWLSPAPLALPEPEISLNYLGVVDPPADRDGVFVVTDRLPPVSIGAMMRPRLIEVEASIVGGRLALALRYAPRVHAPTTARRLAETMAAEFTTTGTQRLTT